MEQNYELIAKTFMGLEPVLAKELTLLGAKDVKIGRRMVSFTGDKEMMYRANFQLHTAIRILKPIRHFKAKSADDVYEEIKKIEWSQYIGQDKTFSVDSVVFSEEFRHSKFVSYKVKDAIVDQLREATGKRPNISVANPDIRLNMHIAEDQCTLSLDSSGESLHRRGYRQESVEAPLNEVLAAGIQNNESNRTRFYVLSKDEPASVTSERLAFVAKGSASDLLALMTALDKAGASLVYVHDRPAKTVLGEYNYVIECSDLTYEEYLRLAGKTSFEIRYLGSFRCF